MENPPIFKNGKPSISIIGPSIPWRTVSHNPRLHVASWGLVVKPHKLGWALSQWSIENQAMTVPGKYDGGWPLEIQAGTIYCIYVCTLYIYIYLFMYIIRYVHTWYICIYIYMYCSCLEVRWHPDVSCGRELHAFHSFVVLLPDPFRSRCRFKNIRLCSLPLPCAGSTRHAPQSRDCVVPSNKLT